MAGKNLETVQNVKKAEKKLKAVAPAPVEAVSPEAISFDVWWTPVVRALNLPPHIKEIVWADFKSRGLRKEEPAERYLVALRLFGYKI